MTIWNRSYDIDQVNASMNNTIAETLGLLVTEIGPDYIVGTLPVDKRTHQPMGILHGGASVVLAESLGSLAANMVCEKGSACVGLDINANHIRSVRSGIVTGTAKAVHIGRRTQVWEIRLANEEDKTVCVSRLTMAVIDAI
ncbi:Putative esterase [Zhongshania aliphaticivorans]|uniref:Esterase n=1 Tax=Zhongshania aliphaticivorans TaxID=1470434 RepID=A0A5S9NTP3_9GAMM|nr:hotdog fold thioesterase [Zhongshania aliphaticivorans]CAA0093886.1 Putative esterase [Zhongshania aliphaticivorans]CAA0111968.1 Putative esterase [Zhongshania aliphaticivorans]